jgi:NAD(P)-dependent dehydrogenase (short-subunit alcohol dehydrogenase family)
MELFKNKTALIIGATSGIGLSTAAAFIAEGAEVMITGRSQEHLDEALAQLGDHTRGILSDAGSMADLMAIRSKVAAWAEHIDVLYVNAGFGSFAPIEGVDEQAFDALFNVLVKGTFFSVQQILPLMTAGSTIILNTSVVTGFGFQNFSVYSAAKAAVQSFIKTFAAECASRGIRVNGVNPGHISTPMAAKTGMSAEQVEGFIAATIPAIPLRRFGTATEIANTVLFLASDKASYIHGTELTVDGGYLRLL